MNDVVRRVTELERVGRNIVHSGDIASVQNNTVKVRITLINDQTILTQFLPLIGRETAQVGEPVMVLMPQSDFASGYVFCLLKDPVIDALSNDLESAESAIKSLKSQITQIEQRISNLSNY